MTAVRQAAANWSLSIAAVAAALFLGAYLDHKHPDTEELTAQVVADVAADAASNNQEAANVAMKE
jgi:hypothetical protein